MTSRAHASRKVAIAALAAVLAGAGFAVFVPPAMASETGPVIVIPGRPDVPVIMNGRDISYAVVEGDWGLDRPSQTNPRVIYRYFVPPSSFQDVPRAHFFPGGGSMPKLGRREVDRPSNPLPTAQPTFQEWGAASSPTPATSPTPLDVPNTVIVPEDRRRPWR